MAICPTMISHMTTFADAPSVPLVLDILGGRSKLGLRRNTAVDYVQLIRSGLPASAFDALASALEVPASGLASTLHLSTRTLHRRRSGRLSSVESERLLRLARVAAKASHVLAGRKAALRWLTRPNRALEGQSPMNLLDTDVGADEVSEVLDRILYGVFT